ncbi:MAG TPA: hypothetical protein VJ161_12245 [Geobacteraceae bacterium]|nr:hypothetical protein [Geobacteraceae bacterium]
MTQPQAAQPLLPQGIVSEFRDEQTSLIAYNYIFDNTETADEDAYLASGLLGQLHHPSRKLGSNNLPTWDTASIESFQSAYLILFQAREVAVQLFYRDILSLGSLRER